MIRNRRITPQHQCFIRYIIDMYINGTTDETIERYEKKIEEKKKEITPENNFVYKRLKSHLPEKAEEENIRHFSCVMAYLISFFTLCTSEERNNWYEYIDNEHREGIKTVCESLIKKLND